MGFLRTTLVIMPSIKANAGNFAFAGVDANLRTASAAGSGAPLNGGRSQTNINIMAGVEWPFLNLLKEGSYWGPSDNSSTCIPPDTLDANGYPTTIVHGGVKLVLVVPTQTERPGNYCVTWDGSGHAILGGGGAQLGTATFTGSISGTTLTAGTPSAGTIVPGQFVEWSGSTGYTIIMAQLTGATGGAGTYTVSVSQTRASIAMTASGGNNTSSGAANAGRFSCSVSGSQFFVVIDTVGSPIITNMKVFHVDDAALVAAGNVFGQKFKQRVAEANFGVMRFLDWQAGNVTNVTNWASRKPINYVYYNGFEYRSSLYCTTAATRTGTAYTTGSSRPSIHSSDGTAWSSGGPKDKDTVHVLFTDSYTPTNVTFTSGNPSIAMPSHGLVIGDRLHFSLESAGSMPGGITDNTRYYVLSVPDAGHITVSLTTPGGTAVTPSSTGSGTIAANPFLTMNIGAAGAIDILGDYSGWMRGSLYPVGSSFQSLVTLVYDATFNAWIRYGMLGGSTPGSVGINNGVPPEVLLQLCIEMGMHPYFISPPLACDPMTDWHTGLATYCRDNAPAWLIPRFEGPNELWNTSGGFLQTGFAQSKASAYAAADPTHWTVGDFHNWYGKVISTIGQAVAAVYSVTMANVKTQTKYQILAGVQTGPLADGGWTGSVDRLASTSYVAQTAAAQSPYLKSAASNWVTTIACAQYFGPGLYLSTPANGTPSEQSLATAYASGAGDPNAPLTYEASVTVYPSYGITGDFTLPKVANMYAGAKSLAQNFSIPKVCGYEGCYSPDYYPGITNQVKDMIRASKDAPALQGHTTTNLNSFVNLTGGGVTMEFPSNFLIGGINAWAVLDPNIYVTVNPPQWLAIIAFNH